MEPLDIALDVEGVLADSHRATERRSDLLDADTCPPPDWDFHTEEHYEEFMHVSQNLWHNHAHHIPPMVEDLWRASRRLNRHHDVDIVTHRTNVDRQVQEWLGGYGVEYDEFNVAQGHKTDVDEYDVHVDDSQNVVDDAVGDHRVVLLVDRPYNDSVDCTHRRVRRVADVHAAAELLSDPDTVAEINRLTRL